jgi:hypothetical protein
MNNKTIVDEEEINMTKTNQIFYIKDILSTDESAKAISKNLLRPIAESVDNPVVIVFSKGNEEDTTEFKNKWDPIFKEVKDAVPESNVQFYYTIVKPDTTFSQLHNIVLKDILDGYEKNTDFSSHVHILAGWASFIDKLPGEFDPKVTRLQEAINHIIKLMDLLDLPVWTCTASDKLNLGLNARYFTRIDFINTGKDAVPGIPEVFMVAGASNMDWLVIDVAKFKKSNINLNLNEGYTQYFFAVNEFIVKLASQVPGYFFDGYPTVPVEVGALGRCSITDPDLDLQKNNISHEERDKNIKILEESCKDYDNKVPPRGLDTIIKYYAEFMKTLAKAD